MFDFLFFSGHRKMKKQNKKKKRKCVSTFIFFRKMKNNKSVVFFVFCFCSVPRSSLAGTKQHGDNRESP